MANVRKGNVVLTIPDTDIEKYMAKGYSIINGTTGKVIRQSIPTELKELQKAYSEHVNIISQLKQEIDTLKRELLKKSAEGDKKPSAAPKGHEEVDGEDWGEWESVEELDDKPKKKHKVK